MTSEKEDVIQIRLKALMAQRDAQGKPLSHQAVADIFNAEKLPSLSGQPWSKYSVRRQVRKFGLQPEAMPNTQGPKAAPKAAAKAPRRKLQSRARKPEAVTEKRIQPATDTPLETPALKSSSPLNQWNYYESIRSDVEALAALEHSDKKLAKQLNKRGVVTIDGKPFDPSSAAQARKIICPAGAMQVNQDIIREQIREGYFDTEHERFISVRIKPKKRAKGKSKAGKGKDKGKRKSRGKNKGKKK